MTNIVQTWEDAVRRGMFIVAYGGTLDGVPVAVTHALRADDDVLEWALCPDGAVRAAFAVGVLKAAKPSSRAQGVEC